MGRGILHLEWINECIAMLRLDNPQARNAVSLTMMHHFEQHCMEIVEKKARVVILSSTGDRSFCAGGDLHDVRNSLLHKDAAKEMNIRMSKALGSLRTHNVFTIVVLNGAAVGGGAELTTYGDVVFALPTAFIAFVHARLGVSPGWGGGMRLLEKVGAHKARQLLLCAHKVSAIRGEQIGLVDTITLDADKEAMDLAIRLSKYPQEASAKISNWCASPSTQKETEMFLSLWGEIDHQRALGMTQKS